MDITNLKPIKSTVILCILTSLFILRAHVLAQKMLRKVFPHDDFEIREEMVPMRDGAKLYTLILTPKNSRKPLPIILERTPYDATRALGDRPTSRLAVTLGHKFLGNDYVYTVQDIRGRFKSEGDYAMYRVPRGAFNKTETDETTDAWDTIDWLVKNVPSNGRVEVWGTSYPGWLTLAAMRDPHPALAAAVPFNPVVDVWKADDWFHWGAFRGTYAFSFIYEMETRTDEFTPYSYEIQDIYTWLFGQGAAGTGLGAYLDDRHEMWARLMAIPSYGPYWREVAADRWLVEDQRFIDGRLDVATWVSEPLSEPLTVRGPVIAQLLAETTGTDADWVVKLIDVFPDDDPTFEMSGYQLMVSADIFRGRYRENYDDPKPLAPDQALAYAIPLPHLSHTFLPGHRLMVQVQSTWFPLYDRNPQTFVPTIMSAPPAAYKVQRHRVHHNSKNASYLRLYVDNTN